MTNADAIEILKEIIQPFLCVSEGKCWEAIDMAISALEKQEQKKPLTNDVTPIKCTGLNCPMQVGKVDPATCKAADTCEWATKPLTNADKFRALKDEGLAEHLYHITNYSCPPGKEFTVYSCAKYPECKKCWLDWLKQEVSE